MKNLFIFVLIFLLHQGVFSQTNGWHQYTKPSEILKIIPDDVSPDILHLATDIGYIQHNTSTNTVVEYRGLTSQNPAIGAVKDIALNPISADIAMTLNDGVAIYDGASVIKYTYSNSDLTIGENTLPFLNLQVEYAMDGSLYIFKEDAFGYQTFNNGIFDPEVTTSFKPQDIIENNAGTKAYFAGINNGLWELEKSNGTWTNYTMSNSNLTNNFLNAFAVDTNDDLYIGHYQGLDMLASNGSFSNCNDISPIPVFEISINHLNGALLVRNSKPSSASIFGLSIVDFDSCTWTNYREDDTNCLNKDVYSACSYGGNGLVYVVPPYVSSIADIGSVYEFTVPTESCSEIDINYLNAPVAINANVITDFAIREKANGNLELGFNRSFDLHMVEIDPTTFNGSFPNATTMTPYPGNYVYSLINDNDFFIVETNEGWIFIDENNVATTFNHNIPDYLAFVTKKAANYDSENGIINIVHKGFDAAFNIRVYKTQCNTATGTCATSEEIFTTNRDLTQNVLFGVSETQTSDEVHAVAIQTAATPPASASNTSTHQNPENPLFTREFWKKSLNNSPIPENSILLNILFPSKDPVIIKESTDSPVVTAIVQADNISILFLEEYEEGTEGPRTGEFTPDFDMDGFPDEILLFNKLYHVSSSSLLFFVVRNGNGVNVVIIDYSSLDVIFEPTSRISQERSVLQQEIEFIINESTDFFVIKSVIVENPMTISRSLNEGTATMALLTNYGLLIKTDVDLSQLILSIEDTIVQQDQILMYPNPSSNMVSFLEDTIASAAIYDINGRHIKDITTSSFSIKELAKGVYIVKAKTNTGASITRKLIKN